MRSGQECPARLWQLRPHRSVFLNRKADCAVAPRCDDGGAQALLSRAWHASGASCGFDDMNAMKPMLLVVAAVAAACNAARLRTRFGAPGLLLLTLLGVTAGTVWAAAESPRRTAAGDASVALSSDAHLATKQQQPQKRAPPLDEAQTRRLRALVPLLLEKPLDAQKVMALVAHGGKAGPITPMSSGSSAWRASIAPDWNFVSGLEFVSTRDRELNGYVLRPDHKRWCMSPMALMKLLADIDVNERYFYQIAVSLWGHHGGVFPPGKLKNILMDYKEGLEGAWIDILIVDSMKIDSDGRVDRLGLRANFFFVEGCLLNLSR